MTVIHQRLHKPIAIPGVQFHGAPALQAMFPETEGEQVVQSYVVIVYVMPSAAYLKFSLIDYSLLIATKIQTSYWWVNPRYPRPVMIM